MKLKESSTSSASHLGYLDGIRGLAALYVLVEHAQLEAIELITLRSTSPGGETMLQTIAHLLNDSILGYGHLAVDVFIVLSGYCLMLPVARSENQQLRGGVSGYVRRRARRILPPYYCALAVAIGVFVILNAGSLPTWGNCLSHVLLVHNLSPQWLYGITPPLWSVAVEWQIYFVFALVLLPVWRRLGAIATIIVALILGVAPVYVLPAHWNLEWSCPWYVVLFASGMLAAAVSGAMPARGRTLTRWPWGSMVAVSAIGTVVVFLLPRQSVEWARALRIEHRGGSWLLDVCVGVTMSLALLGLASSLSSGHGRFRLSTIRFLQSRPIAGAGALSYSLYLIHAPAIALVARCIGRLEMTPLASYLAVYAVGVPLGLSAAIVLYLAVERHCTTTTAVCGFSEAEAAMTAPFPSGFMQADAASRVPQL